MVNDMDKKIKEENKINKKNEKNAEKATRKTLKKSAKKTPAQKAADKEKLKKYFNQKTFLVVTLTGLLAVVVVYVFVFLNLQVKTDELEAANAEKQKEVEILEDYYNNLQAYKSDISLMSSEIKDILDKYPADAREEDIIMLAVKTQENNSIGYDSINMEPSEVVYDIPLDMVQRADSEDYQEEIQFIRKHAIYVNTTTYEDLKSVVGQIFASANRIGIDNIAYTKNEEDGTLSGSIDLYFYSAMGTGKEYTVPDIKSYPVGTADIFRSDSVRTNEQAAGDDEGDSDEDSEKADSEDSEDDE